MQNTLNSEPIKSQQTGRWICNKEDWEMYKNSCSPKNLNLNQNIEDKIFSQQPPKQYYYQIIVDTKEQFLSGAQRLLCQNETETQL